MAEFPKGVKRVRTDKSYTFEGFSNLQLQRKHFKQIDFSYANLENARFEFAQIAGANFTDANLKGATFFKRDQEKCLFSPDQMEDIQWIH
ncbi:pentapeptide repeat-containing protein [Sporosarcina limicola]|uniref:Uncharacterized protein YjbI with pentapeptide repeats n=1 Tax=Sporosarcina limicola TaxID=34101 RepID=A0A927RE34_9BACL|nr:uncharacterized protein YjbI with pentapeptide repeats [Sporosarcina limicola]